MQFPSMMDLRSLILILEVQPQLSLGTALDLCSVLGQNGFSSGTAQLLSLCISNSLIVQFLSASLWIWMFFFTKRILSFALCLFIFLILSARLYLASSDFTSSFNIAIPIFSSDAILNCLLSCLCTPRHSLILVSFLLLPLWLSPLFLLLLMPNISLPIV